MKERIIAQGYVKNYALEEFLKGRCDKVELQKESDFEVEKLKNNFTKVAVLPVKEKISNQKNHRVILDKNDLEKYSSLKSYKEEDEEIKRLYKENKKKFLVEAEIEINP